MAARNYGSTGKQRPYCRLSDQPADQAEFSQVSARAREQETVVKTNLQRLERLAQDFGTARDGLQLRDDVQQLMRELYGQIQQFNKECMTLENPVNRTDGAQIRAAANFRRNVNESISKFQRLCKDVERLERDNPLQHSNPFGETDDYYQYSRTSAGQSTYQQGRILSLEQDRRLVEQRNEALNHLFHDIQDLNHLARDLAEVVYDREDRINKIDVIEDNVEAAADNVSSPLVLRTTVRYQKKNRKLKVVIAVIIPIILAILAAIILGLCIGTPICRNK